MKKLKQAKEIWHYLLKKEILSYDIFLMDNTKTLPIVKEVAVCILANPGITLEEIINHPYFVGYSRSTLKRAVSFLHTNGYIKFTRDSKDKRRNLLYFKKVN